MSRDLTDLTGLTDVTVGVKYVRLTLDVRGKDAGTAQGSAAAATRNAARIFMASGLAPCESALRSRISS